MSHVIGITRGGAGCSSMSTARLVITAVTLQGVSVAEAARRYGVHRSWIYKLLTRYANEGEAAFEPRSRRPRSSPNATPPQSVTILRELRARLVAAGLDAGAETLVWHLAQHHHIVLSRSTVHRILVREGLITPEPKKRPKSSYLRFQADQPGECWQSDFTHYRLTHPDGRPGQDVEIITWLDDHSRYALHLSAHHRITTPIVLTTFTQTTDQHGYPASTLTDNGMVYTVRYAGQGRSGGRNAFENHLRAHGITQKNGAPNHPQTQGKVERFQQTMKKWLRSQPDQPATIGQLQELLQAFQLEYNTRRPHRSLPHQATPAAAYTARPKAGPSTDPISDTHDRVRTDRIGTTGTVTLRVASRLHHIGVGRAHAGTYVRLLIRDLDVTIIDLTTGEILRELTIDPTRNYQPLTPTRPPATSPENNSGPTFP